VEQQASTSPGAPAITQIVGQLIEPAIVLPDDSSCLDIDSAFVKAPDATSLVLKTSACLLLVDRREFEAEVARMLESDEARYLDTRGVDMISITDTLVISSSVSLDQAYSKMEQRPIGSRYKDVIVANSETGAVGLIPAATLLDEVARANARDALHDPLTGLANRALLLEWVEHGLTRRDACGEFALIFIDLDRFKIVNDSIGHSAGDELLIAFADRLMQVVRPTDAATRLGGDEFALLLDGVTELADAGAIALRLLDSLREPMIVSGRQVVQTASIGIVIPEEGDDVTSLLRKADIAMYDAKRAGGNRYHYFDGALAEAADQRLDIEIWLRRAIDQELFEVRYHPIVELDSLRLRGFEALVRGSDPERGLLSPAEFLDVAEETGMIIEIDRLTTRNALLLLREWQDCHGASDITMNVNLSTQGLNRAGGLDSIYEALQQSGIDPRSLQVEVTETGIIRNIQHASESLQALRDRGIRVAIDDFGTGYSSMAQLSRLPFDTLKIDGSFVSRMAASEPDAAIVRLMIAFARALNLDAVAEGLETAEELELLREMGCGSAQGYLFAMPLSAEDATRLLVATQQNGGAIPIETAALQHEARAA
jgi:diguanylate cyclase (GGDEF)-like protein